MGNEKISSSTEFNIFKIFFKEAGDILHILFDWWILTDWVTCYPQVLSHSSELEKGNYYASGFLAMPPHLTPIPIEAHYSFGPARSSNTKNLSNSIWFPNKNLYFFFFKTSIFNVFVVKGQNYFFLNLSSIGRNKEKIHLITVILLKWWQLGGVGIFFLHQAVLLTILESIENYPCMANFIFNFSHLSL